MIRLGQALTDPAMKPPVKALYVYNSNPASVVPNQELVLRGLAREDLFTVVHEQHLTDTTDYADIVLPATTSMEHVDLYKSFGHLYVQLAEPVIEPAGESRSNWRVVRLLARAMGLADPHFSKDEPALIREVLASGDPSVAGITYERLKDERSVRLSVGRPYLPFADGAPTPSGKVEFVSESMARAGLPSLPTYVPLVEGTGERGRGAALPAPVHRAAQPLLPELVLQPVGHAEAPPAGRLGVPPSRGCPPARHRGRRRRDGAERPR